MQADAPVHQMTDIVTPINKSIKKRASDLATEPKMWRDDMLFFTYQLSRLSEIFEKKNHHMKLIARRWAY